MATPRIPIAALLLSAVPDVTDPDRLGARLREGTTRLPAHTACVQCGAAIWPVVVWAAGAIEWKSDDEEGCLIASEGPTGAHIPPGNF